jgi:glycine hydroxymethyltransferase
LGTPAVTTRGMKESEMKVIAKCIARVIDHHEDHAVLKKTREEIVEMCKGFPLYPNMGILK